MFITITPVAKPRMTVSDRWAERPPVMRYRAFCEELRLKYPNSIPNMVSLIFYMPIPKSVSKKRRLEMIGMPHMLRPDIDNLIKAVFDAICSDDSYISEVHAKKLWSDFGGEGIDINVL